ncbi:hypothetical protein [Microbacterium telephonicum]|uniref:Uncharacterized protein n=1 Tax=Microbacterium telephonicum TaxID=1714841 RepID=A0A498CBB0_9MICO|nr:hypothetical protein [Microbacterium telephonicum]RLK52517.1 hypothetical protein C7474_0462 [Microbacterium telephonicum]
MNIPVSAAVGILAFICLALAVQLIAALAAVITFHPRAALRHTLTSGALLAIGTVIAVILGATTAPTDYFPA